ncbi:carotenoid oxygenase family protein [Leptolyngbya sp. 7M]|uniref:carotenoid oxygenase family protein n=1 Tax=Leptolyngbya sp. 7M TaxID=2812896 RepID=UPI001B8B075D|nr:carotenoid oxygenase family protein [Leptolyngbya sp. 7M]QYO64341.1 carotenoid oxygenase family protein [Leptolyngbya sp. 7M]
MKAFVPSSVSKASRTEGTWTLVPQANQTLPAGLDGHGLIVAPLPPPEDQPQRGERAFPNGDGMIYRLSFENETAKLTTAIAKTPCYYADLAAQYDKRYKSLAFRDGGVVRMSLALGSRNQLNTAFLKTNRRLLITYDAGRPYTLDPQTLEVVEPIGATKDWIIILGGLLPISNIFQPYSGSAHPVCVPPKQPNSKQEPDEGFIVNYSSGYNGKFKVPVNRFLNRFFKCINQIKLGPKRLFTKDEKINSNEYWGRFTDLIRYKSGANPDQSKLEFKVERWRLQLPDGQPVVIKQSVHQMGITEKFIILVSAVQFSQDGQTLASTSLDRTVKLWTRNSELITTLQGHQGSVLDVQFSPDGQFLVSNSKDGTVKLWRRDGELIGTLQGHEGPVWSVKYLSPETLISASADNTIRLWEFNPDALKKKSCDWLNSYFAINPDANHRVHDQAAKLCL